MSAVVVQRRRGVHLGVRDVVGRGWHQGSSIVVAPLSALRPGEDELIAKSTAATYSTPRFAHISERDVTRSCPDRVRTRTGAGEAERESLETEGGEIEREPRARACRQWWRKVIKGAATHRRLHHATLGELLDFVGLRGVVLDR